MKIEKTATIMMIPFYLESSDLKSISSPESLWSVQEMKIEEGFLYPHVQQFLQSSVLGMKSSRKNDCFIYSLKSDVISDRFFHETFSIDSEEPIKFNFYADTDKLLSPKLIICPDMRSGMLMFSFRLIGDSDLEKLMSFNHAIQNNGEGLIPKVFLRTKTPSGEYKSVQTTSLKKIINDYDQHFKFGLNGEELSLTFEISRLVSRLLEDVNDFQFYDTNSYHLFTYFQTEDVDVKKTEFNNELKDDIVRICRKQDKSFYVADYNYNEHIIQLFGNILIGASHEGGCMMVMPDGHQFFMNYMEDVFQERFLWLYILAFLQRMALVNLQKELAEKDVFDDVQGMSLDNLRKETQRLINMKVNTSFSLVSDYSQHNLFYLFCKEKLGVNDLFDDINDKMKQIDSLLEQKSDRVRERNQGLMSIVILLFALCSAANDATDQLVKMFDWNVTITAIITSIVISIIFVIIARSICHLFGWKLSKLSDWILCKLFKK